MATRLSTATALVLALSLNPALAQQTSGPSSGPAGINALTEQQPNQRLARDILGLLVYNAQDQNVGKIDDLVLDKDNKVIAAVIGVGGFLGIGRHDVAIPLDQVQIREEDRPNMVAAPRSPSVDGGPVPRPGAAPPAGVPAAPSPATAAPPVKTMVVRIDATRDQLKSMPSFATLRDQERRRAADTPATAPAPSQVRPQRTQ